MRDDSCVITHENQNVRGTNKTYDNQVRCGVSTDRLDFDDDRPKKTSTILNFLSNGKQRVGLGTSQFHEGGYFVS